MTNKKTESHLKNILKTLRSLNTKVLNFMRGNVAEIIGIVAAVSAASFIISIVTVSMVDTPTDTSEFADTSVMITSTSKRSGGSGVILRSGPVYSEILTNKHVCKVVESGGLVVKGNREYLINAIKTYPYHDLCLVKVFTDFGINTRLSEESPVDFEQAIISGHPALLPHVTTTGSFSGKQIINLMVGVRKCTKKEARGGMWIYCAFLGGIPIIQSFESQLVTGTILPGSSGSGVFTSKGEIAGLVFAGRSRGLGYAFIVPQEYIADFLNIESNIPYTYVNRTKYDDLMRRIFNYQDQCRPNHKNYKLLKTFCDMRQDYMIWKK